ncbi:MAG TPA: hypothetical protein VGT07_11995 [Steroidobacteraceae bacterium]|nr:hypothetical protein [Steroidobacteraceae bacterium]
MGISFVEPSYHIEMRMNNAQECRSMNGDDRMARDANMRIARFFEVNRAKSLHRRAGRAGVDRPQLR